MIAKGSTTIVNFYVTDTNGIAATGQASNITASININGGSAATISATISEKDSNNLPGWYEFEYTFSTAGNAFITFTCSGCVIMPWEEQVVEVSTSSAPSASDIADAVWTKDIDSYNYNYTPGMAYKYIKGIDLSLTNVFFNVSAVKSKTDNLPASPAAVGSAMTLTAAYDAAKTAAQAGDAMTLTSAYDAAKTASQLTSADLSGLSTFDPTNDTVLIDATQAAGMATASGFATSSALSAVASDVSAVKAKTDNLPSSPAATGDIPSVASIQSGLAKTSDLSGLSTFDPSTDTVLIDSAQAATMQTATGFATPNDIPSDYAKPGDAMTLTQAYDAAKTASQLTSSDIPTVSDIQSGLATVSDVSDAQIAIISAMPDVSGLSTFDPSNDTVTIDSTQAATMTTATGFATASDISSAVADLETYGDNHWTGGSSSGGATAAEIWNYSGQGGRTLTASPTDVSTLATKTDLSNVQTAITGAMPSTSGLATAQNVTDAKEAIIAEIPTVPNDYAKASDLSGLSTFNAATDKVTLNSTEDATLGAIKTKVDTLNNADLTGIATASDVSGAQSAIIAAMPTIPNDYAKPSDVPTVAQIQSGLAKTSDLSGLSTLTVNDIPTPPSVEQIQNGLATSANISALQAHGDSHWGISPEGEITVVVDADEIAEAVWNNDERTLTDDISTITAQEIWEYGSRTLTQYGPDISPDEPVGAVYCTPSDVERRWGINNVRQWADLENDGDNAKIQTQIDWAILAASERINSDLAASIYLLPFNPVPYAVRRFAATLAGVELYNTRAVNISRDQSNAEIRTALADYSNWITSVLSNVPIVGATLK